MIDPVAFTVSLGEGIFVKDIYWYGIVIAAGMIIALLVAILNAKKLGKNPETLVDFAIIAIVFAVIGGRLHSVIWSWDIFKNEPLWKVFAVWEGGLEIFGAVIGGILAAIIYAKIKKISILSLLDIVAPSLILGQAIAKWGDFFNQALYGYPVFNERFWHFPITVFIQETGMYHLATFFYESMWSLLCFIVLMISVRIAKKEGKTFFLYMILYGVGRIIIEGMMMNSQMFMDTGIRINQVFSAVFIIIGGAMYLFNRHARDFAIVSGKKEDSPHKRKPGRIQVKKTEYQEMTDEMRTQLEQNSQNKE